MDAKSIIMKKLLILLLAFSLSFCSTRKAEVQKKEETVSVLKQSDIAKTETEKIQADVLRISTRHDIHLAPLDPAKEMKLVYGNDTLVATNADINISTRKDSEKDNTQTHRESFETDKSSEAIKTQKKEKDRKTERKSASWGLNLGIIFGIVAALVLLYFHFRKP